MSKVGESCRQYIHSNLTELRLRNVIDVIDISVTLHGTTTDQYLLDLMAAIGGVPHVAQNKAISMSAKIDAAEQVSHALSTRVPDSEKSRPT